MGKKFVNTFVKTTSGDVDLDAWSNQWNDYNDGNGSAINVVGSSAGYVLGAGYSNHMYAMEVTLANNQYAEATMVAFSTADEQLGVAVRMTTTNLVDGDGSCYFYYVDDATGWFGKFTNDTYTDWGTHSITTSANDIIRIDVEGTTVKCYYEGTQKDSQIDSSFSSGKAGLAGWSGPDTHVSRFECGDLDESLPASDAFVAEATIDLATNNPGPAYNEAWVEINGPFEVDASDYVRSMGSQTEDIAYWTLDTFLSDQYSKVTQYGNPVGNGDFQGVCVRINSQGDGYALAWSQTNTYLGRYDDAVWTNLDSDVSSTASVNGDVVELQAVSTTIIPLENGSPHPLVSAITDSTYSSGAPGIQGYCDNPSQPVSYGLLNWEGGTPFGAKLQSKGNQNDSASSVTTTFDNTPVEGSLLVAAYFTGAASGGVTSSGWTKAFDITDTPNADQGNLWYKIAGASESTSVVAEPSASNENMLVIYEFAGPWEGVAVTLTDSQAAAADSTIELGGTTKSPNELAFAMTTARWNQGGIVSTTDGFVNGEHTATSYKILDTAYRFIATKGTTIATTLTLNNSGQVNMGGLASFTEQETRTSQAFAEVGWQVVNPEIYISQAFVEVGWVVDTGGAQTLYPTGITSAESFGSATLSTGAVTVSPSSIASAEAFGTPKLNLTLFAGTIASVEAFGTAVITTGAVTLTPNSITTAEAFGTATITTGAVTVSPTAIATAEAFGNATVTPGAVTLSPSSITTAESIGSHTITVGAVTVSPSSISSAEAFGNATVATTAVFLYPSSIATAESFGSHTVTVGAVTLSPSSITSTEAFGNATITTGAVTISPSSIASVEAFGNATVTTGAVTVSPTSISTAESFGNATITPGAVTLLPSSIATAESVGSPNLYETFFPFTDDWTGGDQAGWDVTKWVVSVV